MKTILIDSVLEEYQLVEGGEPLSFNPGDPNVYARYMEVLPKIKAVEQEMAGKANAVDANAPDAGEKALKIMRETDLKMKELLNQIFGEDNDFDKILKGVNLMAVGSNGKRIVENLLGALLPIMESGAKSCVREEVVDAKQKRENIKRNQ